MILASAEKLCYNVRENKDAVGLQLQTYSQVFATYTMAEGPYCMEYYTLFCPLFTLRGTSFALYSLCPYEGLISSYAV